MSETRSVTGLPRAQSGTQSESIAEPVPWPEVGSQLDHVIPVICPPWLRPRSTVDGWRTEPPSGVTKTGRAVPVVGAVVVVVVVGAVVVVVARVVVVVVFELDELGDDEQPAATAPTMTRTLKIESVRRFSITVARLLVLLPQLGNLSASV